MGYCLGVDLGTTFVAAARSDHSQVEMVTLGNRSVVMPSAVYVAEDGAVVIGEAADRRAVASPERVAREFKRRLGDPTPLRLGEAGYPATELLAMVLRDVLARVGESEGEPPERVVLTHPANWGPFRRGVFEEVPHLAGVPDAVTITEPEAAAIHYAASRRLDTGDTVAVYDLGGGTFDATVVRKMPDGVQTLGTPEGVERLGGIDFDQALFDFVSYSSNGALGELDMRDPKTVIALTRLRQDCVLAKESLSVDTEILLPVFLPDRQFDVHITREGFENLIRAQIESTITALSRALRGAQVTADELSAVLLVGGSSRIPLVAQMVSEELGRPILLDTHPKYAVALGAATHTTQPAPAQATVPTTVPITELGNTRRPVPPRSPLLWAVVVALLLGGIVVGWAFFALPGTPPTPTVTPQAQSPPPTNTAPPTSTAPAIPIGDPRLVDPCALIDPAQFARFGRVTAGPAVTQRFTICRTQIGLKAGGRVEVVLWFLDPQALIRGVREQRGGLGLVRADASTDRCPRAAVFPDGQILHIRAELEIGPADLCAITDVALEHAVRIITERGVPHRSSLGDANSLRRQNACALLNDETLRRVPALDPTQRWEGFGDWRCGWGNDNLAGSFRPPAVDLFFGWAEPLSAPKYGERVRLVDRDVYVKLGVGNKDQTACYARVAHRAAPIGNGQPGQEHVVVVVYAAVPAAEQCQLARDLAAAVIPKLPPP